MFKKEVLLNSVDIKDSKCNNNFLKMFDSLSCNDIYFIINIFGITLLTILVGNWFGLIITNTVNNKVSEIYFKIIHVIYPTNQFLKRYKTDLSESYVFCTMDTETILHLFLMCVC